MNVKKYIFYCSGGGALDYAINRLREYGCKVIDHPSPEITHALLPVPSFDADGSIKGGVEPTELLSRLPENITIIGGNLHSPALYGYRTIDLMRDEKYVAQNAAITAHCAIREMMNHLPVIAENCPMLIIGWGRIGKCLARLLRNLGAEVSVAARKESDRAMALALGYHTCDLKYIHRTLPKYRVIFNTAPANVMGEALCLMCRRDSLKIDLASKLGIECSGVIWARGLPGKYAPESSGELIAESIVRILQEV